MLPSNFLTYIQKFFAGLVLGIVATLNDKATPQRYRFKTMLREEFSISGKWESVSVANTLVMADVVAMDSDLPLKKRDAIGKASGDIVKIGMRMQLNETQLTNLDTIAAQPNAEPQVVAALFADLPKCIGGVEERLESMFLEGLSTGVTSVEDSENVGTAIRLDFGYQSANKFGVAVLLSSPSTAKPFDDIKRVLDKANADGRVITTVMTDRATIDKIAATAQAKELFAFSQGINTTGGNIPSPTLSQLNTMVTDRFGFVFDVVERSVKVEKNGNQTTQKPWQAGMMVFLTDTMVGTLVYARLAEENHPTEGVEYQKPTSYTLVSMYRKNEPSVAEHTRSQARVVPVIGNVQSIYQLDTTVVQA